MLAIVTERAAPTAIEAAHRHLASHPKDRILLRTPAQLMAADDAQLGQWIGAADSILAVSLFGDPARRLKDALARHARPPTPVLAMNGEAGLSLMSRDARGNLHDFPAETLRQLAWKIHRNRPWPPPRPAHGSPLAGRPPRLASWRAGQYPGAVRPSARPAPAAGRRQARTDLASARRQPGTERFGGLGPGLAARAAGGADRCRPRPRQHGRQRPGGALSTDRARRAALRASARPLGAPRAPRWNSCPN